VNRYKENRNAYCMLACLFLYMWVLNCFMPLHRDDYEYALIWGTNIHLTGLSDILQSLYRHYFMHGGRMVAFFVQEVFLVLGKTWFNLFNAFLYTYFIILLYWHGTRRVGWKFNPYVLGLVMVFAWFGLPDWGLTNIWMCGSCVYLFTTTVIFTMLLPYHMQLVGRDMFADGYAVSIGMFLCGIISGWTFENTGVSLNLLLLLACMYAHKKGCLKKWMVAGFGGTLIGFVLLIAAPGNLVRSATTHKSIIDHFLNPIGTGVEIFLGLLLIAGFLMLAWRILLVHTNNTTGSGESRKFVGVFTSSTVDYIRISVAILMIVSKLYDSFISKGLAAVICQDILAPLGLLKKAALQSQLTTTLSGVEDVTIYILLVVTLFKFIFARLNLLKRNIKPLCRQTSFRSLLRKYPETWFSVGMLAMALVTHLVMIASPIYPGRAGYGSVVFLIICVINLYQVPQIRVVLFADKGRRLFLRNVLFLAMLPLSVLAAIQYYGIYQEDGKRMEYVEQMYTAGAATIELAPIRRRNEILRHVYFVDFPNSVTSGGFKRYFGFDEIKMK